LANVVTCTLKLFAAVPPTAVALTAAEFDDVTETAFQVVKLLRVLAVS
jgi:hypothetical protein